MSRRSHHRRNLVVLAGLGVAVLIAATREGSEPASPSTASALAEAASDDAVTAGPRFDPDLAALMGALDPSMLSADALREALEQYQRDSVYPPSSHLFSDESAGEMMREWNDGISVELPLDDREGQETVVHFGADRNHVGFAEALTTWIEVWPAGDRTQRVPLEVHSAVVLSTAGARQGRTDVTLVYRDDGLDGDAVAGDHIYTNRFVPSERDELGEALRVHISANIESGGVERLITRDFTYTPRPLLELTAVDTAVVNGSLAVVLDLTVHEPGQYLLYCDVYAADGETPIGWITEPWSELAAGTEQVSLSLFGKVLHDRGIAGPYVIKGIRAMRQETDREMAQWWSDPREFHTAPFELTAFSAAPWDSAERRELIATLERSIDEQAEAERRNERAPR